MHIHIVSKWEDKCERWRQEYIYREKSFAVAAFEAGFMIRESFKGQHINHINSLITSLAFIQSSCKCHCFLPNQSDPKKPEEVIDNVCSFLLQLRRLRIRDKFKQGKKHRACYRYLRQNRNGIEQSLWFVWIEVDLYQIIMDIVMLVNRSNRMETNTMKLWWEIYCSNCGCYPIGLERNKVGVLTFSRAKMFKMTKW